MTDLKEKQQELSETKPGFGEPLKEERLRQGLSLELISSKTGINITNLTALENSARRELPADVFSRGFIKIYAQVLQIDPKKSLDSYEQEWGFTNGIDGANIYLINGELAKKTSVFEDKQALTFIGIVLTVAVIFLAFQLVPPLSPTDNLQKQFAPSSSSTTPQPDKVFSLATSLTTAIDPTMPLNAENDHQMTTREQENIDHESLYSTMEEKEVPSLLTVPQENAQEGAIPEPPLEQRTKAETSTKITTETYTLRAEFSERTWLKITIDQNEPAEYTFHANEKYTWPDAKKFKLIIGNTGGIQLFLNDSKLELDHGSGKVMTLSLP